jgi:hypothetical protein
LCGLRALQANEPLPLPTFDESREAHMERLHPDPEATERERRELLEGLVASYLVREPGEPPGD